MTRHPIRLVVVWIASLLVVALLVQVRAQSQNNRPPYQGEPNKVAPVPPIVVSGSDIGFRVTGKKGRSTPVGELVIRIDGRWVPVDLGAPEFR